MRLDMPQTQRNNGSHAERRPMETQRNGAGGQVEGHKNVRREPDQTRTNRQRDIRSLLRNASPNNPTYILAVVMADFNSQGFTELSVKKGDEIYAMYEIDDWAYVACLTETSRRGYIPVDFCLPVEDFFYHNPNLQEQLLRKQNAKCAPAQHGLYTTRPQPRQTRDPIEGAETRSTPEHRYKQLYHTTGSLITLTPSNRPTSNVVRQPFTALRRSNTVVSTPKPTAEQQIKRTSSMNGRTAPTVSKKPSMPFGGCKPLFSSPTQTLPKSAGLLIPPPVAAKPKLYIQTTSRPAAARHQSSPDLTSMATEKVCSSLKGKKTRTHLSMDEQRRSSSLETVDERSELEESLNSSATSPGGIQRLIAKFQSKIKEDHRDLTGSVSRLNSTGSTVSSIGEDSDNVFVDNDETMQTPHVVLSSTKNDNSKENANFISSNTVWPSDPPIVRAHSSSSTISDGYERSTSCNNSIGLLEVSQADNRASELSSPNLSTLDLADSGMVSEDGVSDNLDFDDSILEPPASFSSPSLSESTADIDSLTPEVPPADRHCCCCVHYRQTNTVNTETQVSSIHSSTDSLKREILQPESREGCQTKELHIKAPTSRCTIKNGKTTSENKQMRDESTQTAINDSKEAKTTKGSTFSRNAQLRQSRLCDPSADTPYLLQPISPASITEHNESLQDSHTTQREHQFSVRL